MVIEWKDNIAVIRIQITKGYISYFLMDFLVIRAFFNCKKQNMVMHYQPFSEFFSSWKNINYFLSQVSMLSYWIEPFLEIELYFT